MKIGLILGITLVAINPTFAAECALPSAEAKACCRGHASNDFDYFSLTDRKVTNGNGYIHSNNGSVEKPIPLPSKEFVDTLFANATNSVDAIYDACSIMGAIGRSVRDFRQTYNQQEVDWYAFNCLSNAINIADSLLWTCHESWGRYKWRLVRSAMFANDLHLNKDAVYYLADYIGTIPVIVVTDEMQYNEAIAAKAADKALQEKTGRSDWPNIAAYSRRRRLLMCEKHSWNLYRDLYIMMFQQDIAPQWKKAKSHKEYEQFKSDVIKRARLSVEDIERIFGK